MTLPEKLVRHCTSLGMTRKETAAEIGVDQGTLARWKRGEREPTGALGERVRRFLSSGERKRNVRRAV